MEAAVNFTAARMWREEDLFHRAFISHLNDEDRSRKIGPDFCVLFVLMRQAG